MEYLVVQLHEEWGTMPYHHDSLLIDGVQRAYVTYAWQDGDWRKGIFILDRMDWDPIIEGSLHTKAMEISGMIQGHIWDPGKYCSDHGGASTSEDACSGIA